MTERGEKNPIEQRLDYLEGLWNEFVQDPEARLLRWVVDGDGARMVELLIELQSEEVGTIPDLFIRFDVPFTSSDRYPDEILRSFREQYDASRQEIEEAKLPVQWQFPAIGLDETTLQLLIRTCAGFRKYYAATVSTLALFLAPSQIDDPSDWSDFLAALLTCEIPSEIRFTVLDHGERPLLTELGERETVRIRTVVPELDMPGALEEIADGAEGVGPGNDFRKLFVRLGNLAATGDIKATNKTAVKALRIARKHKWFDLVTAVYMVLGAMYSAKRDSLALKAYQYAGRAATQAEKDGNPAGSKLVIQTRFAEAAALVGDGGYAQAAPLYEGIAGLATAQEDAFLELEAWRMASYCHEMDKQPSKAWKCGQQALDAGERLDDELRPSSTLPYVGQRLLGLLNAHHAEQKYERQVRKRMAALVGKDWMDRLVTKEARAS